MSPAGSGRGQFRGGVGARVGRADQPARDRDLPESRESGVTRRQVRSVLSASDWTWVLPWLFPLGLLGTVALISLANALGYLLVTAWGWLVFPFVAACIRSLSRASRPGSNGNGLRDDATDYWRTKSM